MLRIRTEDPESEPVDLEDVRNWLNFTGSMSEEDPVLEDLIASVRDRLEDQTNGRAFITQTWELWLDAEEAAEEIFPHIVPLLSVTSIYTYDSNDQETLIASGSYSVRTGEDPRIALNSGETWGGLRDYQAVKITLEAGYGPSPADIPPRIRELFYGIIQHGYSTKGTGVRETVSGQLIGLPHELRSQIKALRVYP